MADAPASEEDGRDARWHSLGLLDDHIKSLKRQIEVLAQELRTAVAERDQLLSELGVLQWPGLERDARFLLRLPGSGRNGSSAEWRLDSKTGHVDGGEGAQGEGEAKGAGEVASSEGVQKQGQHKRGQSWAGGKNKMGVGGAGGMKLGRSRIRSMDSGLGMDALPFGGDLPTPRGPAPDQCKLPTTPEEAPEEELEEVPGAPEACGKVGCDDGDEGTPKSSDTVLSPIVENDIEAVSEDVEEIRDVEMMSSDMPDSPVSLTDSEPSEGTDESMGVPSDECPETQEGEHRDEQVAPAGDGGVVWLSNGAFYRNASDSPAQSSESDSTPDATVSAHHPQVRMRTTHVVLVEKANRAARLSKELFQAKFALHDSQSQLQFLTEKMLMYKNTFQDEVRRHEEETCKLRSMLNEATTSKFIMFCKLSECQEKVQQLEEHLVLSRAMGTRAGLGAIDENVDQNGREALARLPDREQGKVDNSPRWVRGSSMSTIERGACKVAQSAVGSGLQQRLTETMRRLLEAENRGDLLQQRLKEMEAQLKRRGSEDSRSVQSTDQSSGSGSSKRSNQSHTWNELKQTRLELKRTKIQLHKCEGELSASNRIRYQQEAAIGKLKMELKEVKRRKPPSWR